MGRREYLLVLLLILNILALTSISNARVIQKKYLNPLQDSRLVYKHYATLYFVLVFDSSENELAMLDLIQGTFSSHSLCIDHCALLYYFWHSMFV
jgi:hypothetical protein